jgi:DNA-binding beta-propeller fold protein YncE
MRWRKLLSILTLALASGVLGCGGGSSSSGVTLTISPTSSSVITNRTQLFSSLVTGSTNTAVTWTVTCPTGVTAPACGMIDSTGLYTAPATIPTVTTNGTTTIAPTATITATAQADTTKTQTATVTIVTGIRITITPGSATVGTDETFKFTDSVNNPGCNLTATPNCLDVTWSVSTTLTGIGSIDSSGVYTAPSMVPTPSAVTITATSVADTSVTATAVVSVVTAADPTVTSVSPNETASGGLFQDVYITGTNFISTNKVCINCNTNNSVLLDPSLVTDVSSSVIRARIPDFLLANPPSTTFQFSVSKQSGTPQTCTTDASKCQVTLTAVRPGVIGPSPASISQSSGGVLSFNVDGGFFGTSTNPAVTATYNGQLRAIQLPASGTTNSTRQLQVTIGGGSNAGDLNTPGLYPVALKSNADPTKSAVANLAVQPSDTNLSIQSEAELQVGLPSSAVAASPSDVAVNPATGIAVVANTGSNDVTLIDINPLDPGTPKVIQPSICTAAVGAGAATAGTPCPASGPTSVAVDYVRHIALVVNSTAKTVAVLDLNTNAVTNVTPALTDTPGAIGVNPATGRALVAMQSRNYGVLMDLTQNPPVFAGVVSISTGPNTRVAVEPHLNWALATPGGLGSVGIVDLNQQNSNQIAAISRTTNVVTVTVQSTASSPALTVKQGDAVEIQNIQFPAGVDSTTAAQASTLDGFYTVSSVGPASNQFSYTQTGANLPDLATQSTPQAVTVGTVNYAQPVATVGLPLGIQGISINPETQKAVLVDPTTGGVVTFFSLIDQTVSSLALRTGNSQESGTIAAAFNPLTNTVVAVNFFNNTLSVIDPATPRRLNDGNLYTNLSGPVAVAVDPGTNTAVVVNQTSNTVSVLSLGPIQLFSITETSPKTVVTKSTFPSQPAAQPQPLHVFGKGLKCMNGTTNMIVRLDGIPLQTSCTGSGDRELTANVPANLLNSPRRFALDVADGSGNVTNAEDFTVEQSVDLGAACASTAPLPSGVAVDPVQNIAAVSLFGCNSVALINLATDANQNGTGQTVAVGTNPVGVAVIPRLHLVAVANNGSGNATIIDDSSGAFVKTVETGSGPMGAAADPDTGEFAIANSLANTVTVVNAGTGGTHSISAGQRPVAVGFNYVDHQIAVAATGSNSVGVSDASAASASSGFSVNIPTSVVYDPVPSDCGSNGNSTAANTVGCFLVDSSTNNVAEVIDPVNSIQSAFRIGINPTAIAYNYLTSTLVSTNTASHTVTVADFLGRQIRAVLTLPPAPAGSNIAATGVLQFALDVDPFANLAVIADTANGHVLLIPLPR